MNEEQWEMYRLHIGTETKRQRNTKRKPTMRNGAKDEQMRFGGTRGLNLKNNEPKNRNNKKTSDKVKRGLSVVNELRFHLSLVTIESLKNALSLSFGSKFYNLYD